jgi:hypothetical protein
LLLAGGEDVDGERVVMQQVVALGFLVDGHQDQRGFERDRREGVDREAPGLVRSLDCDDCYPGAEAAEAGTELEGVQALTSVTRACGTLNRIRFRRAVRGGHSPRSFPPPLPLRAPTGSPRR